MIMWLFPVLVFVISNISLLQCTEVDHTTEELREDVIYFENDVNPRTCTDMDISMWPSAFDACFITRKIGGVGWNLANTIDRILQHARDCLTTSKLPCRPNYNTFQAMMNKVINELKDYSVSFWLEMNFQGKKTMKDLDCVENVLSIHTYANCFEPMFDSFLSHENFLRKVETAISCTNELNKLCSDDAKTSLNKMVRTLLGVKQPAEEDFDKNVEPTTPHSSDSPPSSSPPSPDSLSSFRPVRIHRVTTLPPSPSPYHGTETPLSPHTSTSLPNSSPPSPNQHHSNTKTSLPPTSSTLPPTSSSSSPLPKPSSSTPPPRRRQRYTTKAPLPPTPYIRRRQRYTTEAPPPPSPYVRHQHSTTRAPPQTTRAPPPPTKRWYDYILDPIISVWNWFTSLFG